MGMRFHVALFYGVEINTDIPDIYDFVDTFNEVYREVEIMNVRPENDMKFFMLIRESDISVSPNDDEMIYRIHPDTSVKFGWNETLEYYSDANNIKRIGVPRWTLVTYYS